MDHIVEFEKKQGGDDSMDDLEDKGGEFGASKELREQKVELQAKIRTMLNEWFSTWDRSTDDIPMTDAEYPDHKQETRASWLKKSEIPTSFSLGALTDNEDEIENISQDEYIDIYLDAQAEENKLVIKQEEEEEVKEEDSDSD